MSGILKERYFGFYLFNPMWVIDAVNLQSENLAEHYTDLMSEEVFKNENHKYILKLCRDGMFLFKIKSIEKKLQRVNQAQGFSEYLDEWSKYLKYANSIALLFESAFLKVTQLQYFETRELTAKDAFGVAFENGKFRAHTIANFSISEKFQLSRYLSYFSNVNQIFTNPIFLGRQIVSKAVLDSLANDFDSIYDNESLVSMFSELIKSISEFKIANFNTSLVIAWFIVESIINAKWRTWIQSKTSINETGKDRINSKRFEKLEGRDYPISVKMNILELNGLLPIELFLKLDEMRSQRNKIVHRNQNFRFTLENARAAIENTNELIEQHFNFKVFLNLSLSISRL